mmetsp:Transcript_77355/g.239562  ORF Transcript_77355/g.239562 Transcript_77355/m.239562 type:complete len:281 (+) Transcript_77355:203-1045(+)
MPHSSRGGTLPRARALVHGHGHPTEPGMVPRAGPVVELRGLPDASPPEEGLRLPPALRRPPHAAGHRPPAGRRARAWQALVLHRRVEQRGLGNVAGPAARHAEAAGVQGRGQERRGAQGGGHGPAAQRADLRRRADVRAPVHPAGWPGGLVELGLRIRVQGGLRAEWLPQDRRAQRQLRERLGLQRCRPDARGAGAPLADRGGGARQRRGADLQLDQRLAPALRPEPVLRGREHRLRGHHGHHDPEPEASHQSHPRPQPEHQGSHHGALPWMCRRDRQRR